MSDLTLIERTKLESFLQMSGGYVLDFSNRTFQEFVVESTGKDIYDAAYEGGGSSKANRLRSFWRHEPNHVVGKLLNDLFRYAAEFTASTGTILHKDCERIAKRLVESAPVQDLDSITPNSGGQDFETLARSVRTAIENNRPEEGLDRLHTFVVRYTRVLAAQHGIEVTRDKPLHSLFGEYVRALKDKGLLQSLMAERILRSSISVLDAFNEVRNEQSFAHDNPILNYDESLLIFNHVASAIKFINALEYSVKEAPEPVKEDVGMPF